MTGALRVIKSILCEDSEEARKKIRSDYEKHVAFLEPFLEAMPTTVTIFVFKMGNKLTFLISF